MASRSRLASYRLSAAGAAMMTSAMVLAAGSDPPLPPPPDTSEWKCNQCPFLQGYSTQTEAGALYANGANAPYGRYSGVNHTGTYADVSANGQWRDQAGDYTRYELDDLGLPSRAARIEGGREGLYELSASYDGQPTYLFDDTVTPYRGAGAGQIALPAGWMPAGSTQAMSALGASLSPIDIEYQRRTVALLGRLFLGADWTAYAKLSHQEKAGTDLMGASFLTEAVQLPEPIDYVTNDVEGGFNWSGRWASVHLAYMGSWFQDNTDSLTFQNPYLPVVPGATLGRMALPPGNDSQQVSLSGEIELPVFEATTLTYSASIGRLSQDAAFLPVSTLPGAAIPSPGSLDGDVHLSHYALALASRPVSRLYVRGSATYDGRDDHTPVLTLPYVVTDTLAAGPYTTPLYSEDRTRLDGSADYRLFSWLKAGVAGEIHDTNFSPDQVISELRERRAWGHVTLTPFAAFSLDAKGGSSQRDASAIYDVAALPASENPLLLAYEYAPRDENFFSLTGSWTITTTLAWSLEGAWADDAYRRTQLGLNEARDRRLASTLTWAPREKLSLYANGSYQRLTSLQTGALDVPGAAPWQVRDGQHFWTLGAGGQWSVSRRWNLGVDYQHAITRGDDTTYLSGLTAPFPDTTSRLDSVWLDSTYRWKSALSVHLRYGYGRFDSNDWALDGVGVDTVPNLLTMGEQPYRYRVNVVALTVVYRFEHVKAPPQQ